jgi:biopolymer transport protein ExbB/TolQ
MNVIDLIKEGGFIMAPLLLCSFVAWAVFFERLYFIRQFRQEFARLTVKAHTLIQEKKFEEAKGLAHNVSPLIGKSYLVVFEDREMSLENWQFKMSRRLKETQLGMKKYLWLLGTIGSSAPFIGLFGTVVGIIKSFESIAASGKSGFTVVAGGLGEALIATAAGIIVAVVAVAFYNFFQHRFSDLNVEVKNQLEDLRELI